MPWFKVDDKFHSHPKVMELSPSAVGLWALAGSWCADYLTDGAIRKGQIRRLGGTEAEAQELVDAGLWIPTDEGWQFRDWTEYQPTREAVEAERNSAKERMRRAREQRRSSKDVRANTTRSSANPVPVPVTSKEVSAPASDDADMTTAFTEWWKHYPKKVDKGQALKAFKAALKKTSIEKLTEATQAYAATVEGKERKYIKNPATWLNAEAWDNEYEPPRPHYDPWNPENYAYQRPPA